MRISVALIAIYFAFRNQNLPEIGKTILTLNPLVFVTGLVIFILAQLVFVLRWWMLLKAQRIDIPYIIAVRLHFIGLFYNNCLPGSVGGDLLRAGYVSTHTDKKVEAVLSVFFDRAIGLAGTITMAVVFFWIIARQDQSFTMEMAQKTANGPLPAYLKPLLLIVAAIFAVVVVAFLATRSGRSKLLYVLKVIEDKGLALIKKAFMAVVLYCKKPLVLITAILLTVICQALSIYSFYLVCKGMQIEVSIIYYFAFFPISWVIGVIPISVGGAGIMEGALNTLFGKVATVSSGHEAIPGLIQRVIFLTASLPGLIIHIKGHHLPANTGKKQDFSVDCQ